MSDLTLEYREYVNAPLVNGYVGFWIEPISDKVFAWKHEDGTTTYAIDLHSAPVMVSYEPVEIKPRSSLEFLTEGALVHYVMPDGQHRPAIVVNAWTHVSACEGYSNLLVFLDGQNDISRLDGEMVNGWLYWVTSKCCNDTKKLPGTWHWIEKA